MLPPSLTDAARPSGLLLLRETLRRAALPDTIPGLHSHLDTGQGAKLYLGVNVFSDFNSSVLEAVLSPNDSYSSILVS